MTTLIMLATIFYSVIIVLLEIYTMNNFKQWIKAAGLRALRTFAQALVASIGCAVVLSEVDWLYCLSASVLSAILSLLMSIAGLPELKEQGEPPKEGDEK